MRFSGFLSLGLGLTFLIACGENTPSPSSSLDANEPPVADAGSDQVVATNSEVTLDGSQSSDPDGDPITYSWVIAEGPPGSWAAVFDGNTASPTFVPDKEGFYTIRLVVNDGTVDSPPDTVTVEARTPPLDNAAPVAEAGIHQAVTTGTRVVLDGTASSDADGDTLSYSWAITSAPTESSAALTDASSAHPSFVPDVGGTYAIRLIVNDGKVNSAPDSVTVTATAPVGPPADHVAVNFTIDDTASKTYTESDGLAWKGSFSYDPASRILTFDGAWSGPFVMVHDDGPWDEGGHEPLGATAGDHLWGVTVWVSNASTRIFEYGALKNSVNGSDGTWIWPGVNASFTVNSGATTPIDATGLVLP